MKKYIIALGLVIPTLIHAQVDRSIRPEAGEAPSINIKDSEVFKTSNGITVILSENHKLPRVTFDLIMGATPKSEGDMAGLSEMAGSLILSGTSNRSKDQIDNQIDYIGADLRADKNSITLSCLTKHLGKGMDVMSDILHNANFPQDEVDRMVSQFESSLISTKSDAGQMAKNVEALVNFPKGHPYGEVMTPSTLSNIDRSAITKYFKETFTPEGSYLVVVGDINKEQLLKIIDKHLLSWTGGSSYKSDLSSGKQSKGNRVLFVKKPGAVQSVVYISFPVDITPSHEDYLALKVLNGVLGGGGFGTRLMQNLREDKAYTYGCYSKLSVDENGSLLSSGGNFRNEVTDSAITQILIELDKITNDYVTDEELMLTKSSMAGSFARSLESPSTIARFALSIIKNQLPKDYYQTYLKKLDAISKDDVLTVAQKYFTSKNCNIVVVGNEEILPNLIQFDADGKIEKLDAFGQEMKDIKTADITADELLEKYVFTITKTTSTKELNKKMKKIKSMKAKIEMTNPQIPFPLENTQVWLAPNISADKLEMNGMVVQKSYFDGEKGKSMNMQTGKKDMTSDEIASSKKSVGLIPEMNYKQSGMLYEMVGIENREGIDCYVIKLNDGEKEVYEYYVVKTYMKIAAHSIQSVEGETQESLVTYGDFEEVNGIIFPKTINLSIGGMNLSGKVVSRSINESVEIEQFM